MVVLTPDEKEDLLQPENLGWTLKSAVAGDDLRYGVQILVNRLRDGEPLTVEQITEILSNLLKDHKESMHS